MTLECSLVEDLYPLYEENELKRENRIAVEAHLKTCSRCSELYQKGIGFSDLPVGLEEEKLPKETDDRIRLRFRLRRMKWIAAILATVLIVTGINQYANNREKVAAQLDGVYLYAESLNELVRNPYEMDTNMELLSFATEQTGDIYSELNWLERNQMNKTSYHLSVNSQYLDEMAIMLHERYSQGLVNETDRRAIGLLQKETETLFKQVKKEYNAFHHGYSSYFEILEIEGIGKPINKIEELASVYTRFHKLPPEIKVIGESEMKKNIRTVFNARDGKVTLEKTIPSNYGYGVYHFDLKNKGREINGEIDGYTGVIISADNISHSLNDKKPMNVNSLMKKADIILKALYGEKSHFKMERSTERQEEPNIYRFTYFPVSGENKLLEPMGGNFSIEMDAGTGEFYRFSGDPTLQSKEFFNKDYKESLNQAAIAAKAAKISGKKVNAIKKGIIYSTISADYVLVYIFKGKENWVYINAENGVAERPYIPIH